jgi:hypothetical protein
MKRKLKKSFLVVGIVLGSLTALSSTANANTYNCDLQAHTCEEYVVQGDGSVMGYLWGWNNTGDYWIIKSIHFEL